MKFSRGSGVVLVGFVWLALQSLLWNLPPYSDSLGHMFPQARLLLDTGGALHAVAASPAVEHPPLISGILALVWAVGGIRILWAHVVSSVIGLVALAGVYRLAKGFTSTSRAVAAMACVAFNAVFFAQAANPYLEIGVVAGLTWAVTCAIEERPFGVFAAVTFMTLSKETSLPLAAVIAAWAVWQGIATGRRRPLMCAVAAIAGAGGCVAWLLYAAVIKGGFMASSVAAASTNGSVPTSVAGLARKLALGPVQLLMMGLWIPVVVLGIARVLGRNTTVSGNRPTIAASSIVLLVGLAITSTIEHGVISIGMNRYYLPSLALLWISTWILVPRRRSIELAILVLILLWSPISYFSRLRYADIEDGFGGVQVARAHRQTDRQAASLVGLNAVWASYPTTYELTFPFLGYVDKPVPILNFLDPEAVGTANWAIVSTAQQDANRFRAAVTPRISSVVSDINFLRGHVQLVRLR